MRNQKNFAAPGRVRQLADVGQKLLGPWDIQRSAGQHEISLHIYFPENKITRQHVTSSEHHSRQRFSHILFALLFVLCNPVQRNQMARLA
jgi:hypothetical protein